MRRLSFEGEHYSVEAQKFVRLLVTFNSNPTLLRSSKTKNAWSKVTQTFHFFIIVRLHSNRMVTLVRMY